MPGSTEGFLSSDEKVLLATELLSQCPPGEFADVLQGSRRIGRNDLTDIQTILGDDSLLIRLHEPIKQRNLQSGATVMVEIEEEPVPVLLTEFNELEDGRYIEPETGTIIAEVEETTVDETKRCTDGLRLALKDATDTYMKQALPKGRNQAILRDGRYHLVFVGDRFQLENMRNGQWFSSWTIDPPEKSIKGEIKMIVHYFEDGNVQLNTSRECELSYDVNGHGTDFDATAQELLKLIRAKEDEVQVAVNEAYGQLAENTFKKLRRQLPITRAKVDW